MGASHSNGQKVIVMGLSGAGKTELIGWLTKHNLSIVSNSQGFTIKSVKHNGKVFAMWDIGGSFQDVGGAQYYKGSKAILYVVDSTEAMRITESCNAMMKLLQNESLKGVPVVVLANKQDRVTALSSAELADNFNLHLIKDRKWGIVACSARTGDNTKAVMNLLEKHIFKTK